MFRASTHIDGDAQTSTEHKYIHKKWDGGDNDIMFNMWALNFQVLLHWGFETNCNLYWRARFRTWGTIVWHRNLLSPWGWLGVSVGEVATPIIHLENVSPELQHNIQYSAAVFEKPRLDTDTPIDIFPYTIPYKIQKAKKHYFDYFLAILKLHRVNILSNSNTIAIPYTMVLPFSFIYRSF